MKKSILFLNIIILLFTMCGCDFPFIIGESKKETAFTSENKPDYSDSNLSFSLYAYAPPGDGIYTIDSINYYGLIDDDGYPISFQTKEKYQEYKDCGFNIIMIQADDAYYGEEFETSHVKELMDIALEVGLKTIIFDSRIYKISTSKTSVIGEDKEFKTVDEFNEYIEYCMKDYSKHEAFYGLLIIDEPSYENMCAIGELYKAIKNAHEDCFIQCNLYPYDEDTYSKYQEGASKATSLSAYKYYLSSFIENTGSDYVMFDSYPMRVQSGSNIIGQNHLLTLQIATSVAKEKNVKVYAVAQTISWKSGGNLKARAVNKDDMYWQLNLYMGLGVKEISYFTYQRKRTNSTSGEFFIDGTSFIKSNGETTDLYYYMKDIHSEISKFANVILNFDLVGYRSYINGMAPCNVGFLSGINDSEFKYIKNVSLSDNSILFITEMYDKEKDQYLYMIMNIADPSTVTDSLTAEVKFDSFDSLSIYHNGDETLFSLVNNKYNVTLKPGEAVYVLPFNK